MYKNKVAEINIKGKCRIKYLLYGIKKEIKKKNILLSEKIWLKKINYFTPKVIGNVVLRW